MIEIPENSIDGKVAMVTGGGQGVGRGICQALAQRGVRLLITGRTVSTLEDVRDELRGAGYEVEIEPGDVGVRADVDRAVATAVDRFGGIDILINNAQALTFAEPVIEISEASLEIPWRSGVVGSLNCMQACFASLKARGGGSIVNFGSSTSVTGMAGFGAYAMAKEGICGLTRVAATEWGPDNIRVNVILPAGLTERLAGKLAQMPAKALEKSLRAMPLRRVGDPVRDIGRAIAALVSDDMQYLTGASLMLDGGAHYIS